MLNLPGRPMRIDLIALDLDGTLLHPDETISERNRAAIRHSLESGVRVVLVTGRGTDVPIRISRELNLNLPVICCHGALTKDFGANRTLVHLPLPLQYAKPMVEYAEQNGLSLAIYSEEIFYRLEGSHVHMDDMRGPAWREAKTFADVLHEAPTFIRFLGAESVTQARRTRCNACARISRSSPSACSRSAIRATTCRCCAGPASASRWATRCPK